MTDYKPADVRAWAREQGIDVSDRGNLRVDLVEAYQAAQANGHVEQRQEDEPPALVIELPAGDAPPAPASPPEPRPRKAETPPQGRKRRLTDRLLKSDGKGHKRVSLESLASWAWGLGGLALQQAPKSTPVGRMLAIQAPVAGVVVDDLCKGTVVDKILQPLARSSEKAEKAFALLGPPVLVSMISSRPETFPALVGPLKVALLSWAELAPQAMAEAEKRASRIASRTAEFDADGMIAALFADLPMAEAPSPDEEAAVRRARGDG